MKIRTPIPPPRPNGVVHQAAHGAAQLARWVELDEAATVFLGSDSRAVTALGVFDGLVSAYDGVQLYREGRAELDAGKRLGGALRVGLGLGGGLPGNAGALCEGLLGGYLVGEGLVRNDSETAVVGVTQMGVATGILLLNGHIGGSLGPALILGSCLTRLGVLSYNRL